MQRDGRRDASGAPRRDILTIDRVRMVTLASMTSPYSKIPSNLGTVLPIALAKLLREVALLSQHNAAMHDDEQRDQHDNAPPRVKCQRETQIDERQGKVERIAGEAKRTGFDDGRGRERWIDVRTCGLHRSPSPDREPYAKGDQRKTRPESNGLAKDRHWPEPTKHKDGDERGPIEQGRPRNDSGVVGCCSQVVLRDAQRNALQPRRSTIRCLRCD